MTNATSNTTAGAQTLNKTGSAVAILLVLILAGGIGALIKLQLPAENHDILLVLITAVATNVTNIVQFFFGSTVGAKAKDDAISSLSATTASQSATISPKPEKPDITIPPGGTATVAASEDQTPTPSKDKPK